MVELKKFLIVLMRDWILLNPIFWAGTFVGYYSMYGMGHFQMGLFWVLLGIVPLIGLFFSIVPLIVKETVYEKYVSTLELRGNERVIDFGCGPGKFSKLVAPLIPDGHLTGIDIDSHAIVSAKKSLENFKNVDFIQEDIRNLPKPIEGYDVIIAQFLLHDIPPVDREKTIQALTGWLKKGAMLHIREPVEFLNIDELKRELKNAGFEEKSSILVKAPFLSKLYQSREMIQLRYTYIGTREDG
jgi:ubiquinone/menaquinone biosynthesis C-methylase UbiE